MNDNRDDNSSNSKIWAKAVWMEGAKEMSGVVPEDWIKNDFVYWPPGINASKHMDEKPNIIKWRRFKLIKIKIRSENRNTCEEDEDTEYEPSQKKQKAEIQDNRSDPGDIDDVTMIDSENDSEEGTTQQDQRLPTLPEPPFLKRRTPPASQPRRSESSPANSTQSRLSRDSPSISPHSSQSQQDTCLFPLSDTKFQKKVLHCLLDIREKIDRLSELGCEKKPFTVDKLETSDELERVEELLSNKCEQDELTRQLNSIGGANVADFLKRSMQKLMSNKLMSSFSLKGSKGKLSFCNLHMYGVLRDTAQKTYGSTEYVIDEVISAYLRYAPDRAGGGGRKKIEAAV